MKVGQFFITSSLEYGWTIDSRKMSKKVVPVFKSWTGQELFKAWKEWFRKM